MNISKDTVKNIKKTFYKNNNILSFFYFKDKNNIYKLFLNNITLFTLYNIFTDYNCIT